MIAPIQKTPERPCRTGIHYARQLVAASLLRMRAYRDDTAPKIAPWKAWLTTVWIVVVTAVYGAYMIGWF